MRRAYSLTALFVLLTGMMVWVVHFTGMYGGASLACLSSQGLLPPVYQIGAIAFSLVVLGGLTVLALRHWRRRARHGADDLETFLTSGAFGLIVISIVAIVWGSLPLLMIAECSG